jgi:hypothetical protein
MLENTSGVAIQTGSNDACSLRQITWSINEKTGVSAGMEMTRKYRIIGGLMSYLRVWLMCDQDRICRWPDKKIVRWISTVTCMFDLYILRQKKLSIYIIIFVVTNK